MNNIYSLLLLCTTQHTARQDTLSLELAKKVQKGRTISQSIKKSFGQKTFFSLFSYREKRTLAA